MFRRPVYEAVRFQELNARTFQFLLNQTRYEFKLSDGSIITLTTPGVWQTLPHRDPLMRLGLSQFRDFNLLVGGPASAEVHQIFGTTQPTTVFFISNFPEHTHDIEMNNIYLVENPFDHPPFADSFQQSTPPFNDDQYARIRLVAARSLTKMMDNMANYKARLARFNEIRLGLSGHVSLNRPDYTRHEGAAEERLRQEQGRFPDEIQNQVSQYDDVPPPGVPSYFGGRKRKASKKSRRPKRTRRRKHRV